MANSYLWRWRSYKGKSGRRGCRYGLQPQKMCLICNDDSASPNSNIAIARIDSREPWNASTNPHSYPFLIRISMISTTPLFRTNLSDHVSSLWFEQREIWLSQEATLSLLNMSFPCLFSLSNRNLWNVQEQNVTFSNWNLWFECLALFKGVIFIAKIRRWNGTFCKGHDVNIVKSQIWNHSKTWHKSATQVGCRSLWNNKERSSRMEKNKVEYWNPSKWFLISLGQKLGTNELLLKEKVNCEIAQCQKLPNIRKMSVRIKELIRAFGWQYVIILALTLYSFSLEAFLLVFVC